MAPTASTAVNKAFFLILDEGKDVTSLLLQLSALGNPLGDGRERRFGDVFPYSMA